MQAAAEAPGDVLAVEEPGEAGGEPPHQRGQLDEAVGTQQTGQVSGYTQAAQETPGCDCGAGGQEDERRVGVAVGRQQHVVGQGDLRPHAQREDGQPSCPEDAAEGQQCQPQQGHDAHRSAAGWGIAHMSHRGRQRGLGAERQGETLLLLLQLLMMLLLWVLLILEG